MLDVADLCGGTQRAHFGFIGHWVANADAFGGRNHPFEERVRDALLQEQARPRHTALARRAKDPSDRTIDRAFQIGVIKDNERRLATEFQRQRCVVVGCVTDHVGGGLGTAGKGDAGDQGVTGQHTATRLTMTGDNIHNTRRNARFCDQLAEL